MLAVASGQEETKEGEQQQSQLTAKSDQAQPSYGYDQQPFVHANAKWFIRTTTTTTSTSIQIVFNIFQIFFSSSFLYIIN